MPIDAQIEALLALRPDRLELPTGDPIEARKVFDQVAIATARFAGPVEVSATEDVVIDGTEHSLAARIYRPDDHEPTATLLFLHGGGFVIGSVDAYDLQCRTLCAKTGSTVLSVDYRLAPEWPFPAAIEDALAAYDWTVSNCDRLGGDPLRVGVAGDSAGGNLAAVVAQLRRNSGTPPAVQVLIYPVVDYANEYPSLAECGDGYMLTRRVMRWFSDSYVPAGQDLIDPRLSPLLTPNLRGLAAAIVVSAEFDPLRDQGYAYADALRDAGNEVNHHRGEGLIHGFFGLGSFSDAAATAIDAICDDVRALLA